MGVWVVYLVCQIRCDNLTNDLRSSREGRRFPQRIEARLPMITTISFFGDSIIRGAVNINGRLRLREGCDFPALKARCFDVNNYAAIGSTILKTAKVVRRHLPDFDESTLVVIGLGGNDCDHEWTAVAETPEGAHLPRVLLQDFSLRYGQLIREVQATGAKVALCTMVPLDAEKFFDHISQGLDAEAIEQWLGDKQAAYRWHENYNRAVERLAVENGCAIIDLRDGFLTRRDFSALISNDGIHPTPAGYEIIDNIIEDEIDYLTALPVAR